MRGVGSGDGLEVWRDDVVGWVAAELPSAPARVLEVGCGEGWLTRHLDGFGHDALGIDPDAIDDPLLEAVSLEDYDGPGSFDAIVAITSLHHIHDLRAAVDRLWELLAEAGTLVVVEFAWDRFDDRTARWCLDRLPLELDDHNWLHEVCRAFRAREEHGEPLLAAEEVIGWASEHGMHPSTAMLDALRSRFVERSYRDDVYLYPDLAGTSAGDERAAIASDEIRAISFRFVGQHA